MPFYTKDNPAPLIESGMAIIGDYSHGNPTIIGDLSKLYIGKLCSIAKGVTIFLGHEHRNDWITTYPFSAISPCGRIDWDAGHLGGHPATKGGCSHRQ